MPRNGSGEYTAPSNSFNPAVSTTTIDADDHNTNVADMEAALTSSIAADGQTPTSAVIPFANGVKTDTIVENSANAGVTIDGVLLKDSVIETDTVSEKTTDAGVTVDGLLLKDGAAIFEGATADAFETTLTVVDPTADRTVSLPDATDTLVGKATIDTLTNKTLTAPTLTSPVLDTAVSGTAVLDEDDMASDSATQIATQQSIKAYIDGQIAGAAATKEMFFPALLRGSSSIPYGAVVNGIWPVAAAQSGSDNLYFTFHVPADFTSLTDLVFATIPDATETVNFDVNVQYAAAGQAVNTHTGSISGGSASATSAQLLEIDISSTVASLAAGDFVGIELDSSTSQIRVLGVRMKYS